MKCIGAGTRAPHAVLNRYDLTVLSLGAVIGAGIFIVIGDTATTADNNSGVGSGVSIAIILAALICFPIALCYAELSTMFPHAGTAYIYTKHAIGDFPAFITGWSLYAPFGMVALAIGWSEYLNNLLKNYQNQLTGNIAIGTPDFNWLAIAIAILMTAMASRELRWSRRLATALLCINVAVAFVFITLAFQHLRPAYWWPLLPPRYSGFQNVDVLLTATASLFYAYTGFETAAALAQDSIAPQKDIPYAIKTSLVIAALMYLLVGLGLTGILSPDQIEKGASLSKAVTAIGEPWAAQFIGIGIVSAFSCVLLTTLLRQSRLGYAMVNDSFINSSTEGPILSLPNATFVTGGIIIVLLLLGFGAQEAVHIFCLSVLFGFCIVCLDLIVLRFRRPELHRPFLVPFGMLVGFAGIGACLVLMAKLPWKAWSWFLLWMAAGTLLFWIRRRVTVIRLSPESEPSSGLPQGN